MTRLNLLLSVAVFGVAAAAIAAEKPNADPKTPVASSVTDPKAGGTTPGSIESNKQVAEGEEGDEEDND